jgi:hypothetical protein
VALALGSSENVEQMAAALLPVAAGAVGSREGALFLSEAEGEYRILSLHGTPDDLKAGLEESLVEQAAASVGGGSEGVVERSAVLKDPEYIAWCEEQGLQGEARNPYFEVYAPLRAHDTVVGILALCRRFDGATSRRTISASSSTSARAPPSRVSQHLLERENARQIGCCARSQDSRARSPRHST